MIGRTTEIADVPSTGARANTELGISLGGRTLACEIVAGRHVFRREWLLEHTLH